MPNLVVYVTRYRRIEEGSQNLGAQRSAPPLGWSVDHHSNPSLPTQVSIVCRILPLLVKCFEHKQRRCAGKIGILASRLSKSLQIIE